LAASCSSTTPRRTAPAAGIPWPPAATGSKPPGTRRRSPEFAPGRRHSASRSIIGARWRTPYPAPMTSEPVTASARAGRRLGLLAIGMTVAGLGTITHPFDRMATGLVAGCTIAALIHAFRAPGRRMRADVRTNRGLWLWTLLAVVLLTWEMFAWA